MLLWDIEARLNDAVDHNFIKREKWTLRKLESVLGPYKLSYFLSEQKIKT